MPSASPVDIRLYRLRRLNDALAAVRSTRVEAKRLVDHYERLVLSCVGEEERLVSEIKALEGACDDGER